MLLKGAYNQQLLSLETDKMYRIATSLTEFDNELNIMHNYLANNAERLRVNETQLTELNNILAKWEQEFALYVDPKTQNKQTREGIRLVYTSALKFIRNLRQQIKKGSIELNEADYSNLYIHIDKTTKTPAQVPVVAPEMVLLKTQHMLNQIACTYPDVQNNQKRALPEGVGAIGRALVVNDEKNSPVDFDNYHMIDNTGRSVFYLNFDDQDEGKYCHLKTWYINTRNKTGPHSEPLTFIIV
ncbi:MAG: hypothetical protein FE834_06855 [Gammaproteobacteria bacterium]|nr:hypothetical protein [Gammaproteobacteria bacterium]